MTIVYFRVITVNVETFNLSSLVHISPPTTIHHFNSFNILHLIFRTADYIAFVGYNLSMRTTILPVWLQAVYTQGYTVLHNRNLVSKESV